MTDLRSNAAELAATALRTMRAEYPYDLRVPLSQVRFVYLVAVLVLGSMDGQQDRGKPAGLVRWAPDRRRRGIDRLREHVAG